MKKINFKTAAWVGLLPALAVSASLLPAGPWNQRDAARFGSPTPGSSAALAVDSECDAPRAPQKAGGEGLSFVGTVMQCDAGTPPCIATFTQNADPQVTACVLPADNNDYSMSYAGGGFITPEGYYYANDYNKLYKYDSNDWSAGIIAEVAMDSKVGFSQCTTYDVSSGTVYGCFVDERFMWPQTYSIGTLDLNTGSVTLLASLPGGENGKPYGIAADPAGNIYVITAYDTAKPSSFYPALYKYDKASKSFSHIGNTNTNLQTVYTSAAFDHKSGKLYWILDEKFNKCSIYEVDATTAATSKVCDVSGGNMFHAVAIPYETVHGDAPALLKDLGVEFIDADGNGKVTFTMPTETYSGGALSGPTGYTVKCGDATLAAGSAQPGEAVSATVAVAARGEVTITVTLRAGSGSESKNDIKSWAGEDVPSAPTGLKATANGNDLTLTWEAPARGAHGGYVNTAGLTYKVVLQPEGTTLAESVTSATLKSTLSLTEPTSVFAEITPRGAAGEGVMAASDRVVAGPAFKTPYFEDFATEDCMNLYTVDDVLGDGQTWAWYGGEGEEYIYCDYSFDNPKDDWFFSPAVHLEAGVQYTVSFKASSLMRNAYREKLEVKIGNAPAKEAMDITILPLETVDNDESWSWFDYSLAVTVDNTGDYNFGFHALSDAAQFKLGIDDFRVEGAPFDAPVAVSDMSALPGPWGVHSATLRFKTPSVANNGDALTALVDAEIYLNNRLYKTIDNPAVGAYQTVSLETVEGMNHLDIYTSNAAGRSIAARIDVYTGNDGPAVPANFYGVSEGNEIHLTWDIPEAEHGGVIDPEGITYLLGRSVNGGETEVLSLSVGECRYTDTYETEEQAVIIYFLSALNDYGASKSALSNCVIVGGKGYSLPFAESFPSGFSTYDIWQSQTIDNLGVGYWRVWNVESDPDVNPADNDLGAVCFQPSATGDQARLFSGCIDLTSARHPVLEFSYRGDGSGSVGQKLTVEGNGDQKKWDKLFEVTLDNTSTEWKRVKVALNRYNYVDRFQIAFAGLAEASTSVIYVDDIKIREVFDHDLSVSLTARRNAFMDEENELTAAVTNVGELPAGAYTVEFYDNDNLIATVEKEGLAVDATELVTVKNTIGLGSDDLSNLVAHVSWSEDDNRYNDYATFAVRNHLPLYPTPQQLTANGNPGAYTFNWAEPEAWVEPEAEPVTDDFESYEPFLIDEIGDWTTYDEDGEEGTFGLIGLHFPYREAPKSWQLFNLWALGIEMADDEVTWRPVSGHQFLVSFHDKDYRNDDWLISPMLSGDAQTISFWTRSLNTFWYEEEAYEVYASKTGKNIEDFDLVYSGEAPGTWTETKVNLPEGTKYFAIKCVSEGYKFAMGLDDITYVPGTGMPDEFELTGYNFYKNDRKVNEGVIGGLEYAHAGSADDRYAVTAVYTTGESRYSNIVAPSGVNDLTLAGGVKVSVSGNDIAIEGAEDKAVAVYTADGMTVYAAKSADDKTTVTVTAGVYLVKVGASTVKVLVK